MRILNKSRAERELDAMASYSAQMRVAGPLGIGNYVLVPPEIAGRLEASARSYNRAELERQARMLRADVAIEDCGVRSPTQRPSDSMPKYQTNRQSDNAGSRLERADRLLAECR